jgi:hypothetical protein
MLLTQLTHLSQKFDQVDHRIKCKLQSYKAFGGKKHKEYYDHKSKSIQNGS